MRYAIEKVVQMIVHDILDGRISRGLLALSSNEDRMKALALFEDYAEVTNGALSVDRMSSAVRFDSGALRVDCLKSDAVPNQNNQRDCYRHASAMYNAIYYDRARNRVVGNNTGFWNDCLYLESRLRLTRARKGERMYFEYL